MLAKALPSHSDCVQSGATSSRAMIRRIAFLVAALSVAASSAPAAALGLKADQQQARQQMSDGKVMSLRQIEAIILPKMRGMEYLGPEYFEDTKIYRLKFIDDGDVIFVDVDARTGAIVRRR